jgi:hypothetical protein
MRRGLGEATAVFVTACALAVVMTWPMAPGIDRLGRTNTGDGLYSLWVVSWVSRALIANPAGLYHANVFYPHRNTLAYSEANITAGVMGVPFYWATRNPFVTHNGPVLIGFALAFIGAYLLAKHLTGSRVAGAAAGIAYTYCPFVFARMAHTQLLMHWVIPFCLLAFHRLVDRPSAGRAAILGIGLGVQALACAYYGVFCALIVGLGTLYFGVARGLWRSPRYWTAIAGAAGVSLAMAIPFFLPFLETQREAGFARTIDDAAMYSANWQAWLTSGAWAHRWALPYLEGTSEVLFPGVITIGLGLLGLGVALRGRVATPGGHARETAGFYGFLGVLAFWASFGPSAGLYTLLFNTIPIFSFLRAPARFGMVVVIALVVGTALALAWIVGRWPRHARIVAVVTPLALVAELAEMPISLREAAPVNTAYRMLATLRPGPVAEFPFFYNRSDFPRHAEYMLSSTYHWQPLINGYSDHIPQDFRDMVIPLSSFPTIESFRILQERKARYAIFHLDYYDRRSREKLLERLDRYQQYLTPLSRENDVWLFEITAWPR